MKIARFDKKRLCQIVKKTKSRKVIKTLINKGYKLLLQFQTTI